MNASTGKNVATAIYNWLHDNTRYTGTLPTMLGSLEVDGVRFDAISGYSWKDYATRGRDAYKCHVTGTISNIPYLSEFTNNGDKWRVIQIDTTNNYVVVTTGTTGDTHHPTSSGTLVSKNTQIQDITYDSYTLVSANPLWDDTLNNGAGGLSISHYKTLMGISQDTKIDAVASTMDAYVVYKNNKEAFE